MPNRSGLFAVALLASAVTLLASCNRSTVSLDYTNAKDEVPALGNLTFRFDQSLVSDSLVDQWDSTEYVEFEPKIPGRFRWEHPDELVFSPARSFAPATSYKATIKDAILKHSKFGRLTNAGELTFHTPDLRVDNVNSTWVLQDDNSTTAVPQVDFQFNYAVNPNSLKDKMTILVGGQPVTYNLQTLSTADHISIRLTNLKMEDKTLPAKITIDKGLLPDGGTNGLAAPLDLTTSIPSPYVLTIGDVTTDHDGTTGSIRVSTSQQLVAANLASAIKFDPAVKFTAQATETGLLIQSDNFDESKSYTLTIGKGVRGRIGGVLHEEYSTNVTFGELEPSISFANDKGVYLSGKGAKNIEVKIVNVPRVKVVVSKIYENNLLTAQHSNYRPQETKTSSSEAETVSSTSEEEGDEPSYDNSSDDQVLGDVIYEQEIDTRTLPRSAGSSVNRILNLNFTDKLPEFKGIYHVLIRSTKNFWLRDSRFISLSDIGMIAKEGKEKILVFANSIKSAAALSGVAIQAYGANNQLLGTGTTDANGVAEIAYSRREFAGFRPAMLIARSADDFNYLHFGTTRVNTSRFEVGGRRSNPSGLDAYIYPERDIYRPGERVNFSVILRDRQWKSPGELPVVLKFLLPNGKELKTFRKTTNAQGSIEGNVDLGLTAITGSYSLEVYTSNEVLLASQPFRIEEFVPDRIKVTAQLNKTALQPGDAAKLDIHAVNFFGPPAANRNYECEIQVHQQTFRAKDYDNYDFSLSAQSRTFEKNVRQGKTDDKGNATEHYDVPDIFKNIGLLHATFFATVFDETGRPVSKSAAVDIYTQPVFFGVADDGYYFYPLNEAVNFPLIALDRTGKIVNGSAQVEVVKHEYHTVLTKNGDYFRYESQRQDKMISSSTIAVSGDKTVYTFTPRSSGDYEIRVSIPGANSYVSREFYSWGDWGGDNSSFQVNNEGHIDISVEKTAYNTGESVGALFKTPFDGRMLVTLETDKVISYQFVDVSKRTAHLSLPLTEDDIPNVYITATLIKAHELSDIPLTVAHGFQSVKVEAKDRHMPVEITAQTAVRSHTHQKVTVKAAPGSMITLAAVDNGVLQVSDFTTPDPYAHFYAKRALEVTDYDLYPLLFPEIKAALSSTGGDESGDMKKRTNPMPAKRIKIVSYWSGIAHADGSGEASFEFDIPQFSGSVRLMAVAYKDENFGSKDVNMTVADPIVLSSALPRFMSPGDTVTMPVTISNTTAASGNADVKLHLSGPLHPIGDDAQSLSIGANSEGRAEFKLAASPSIGIGKVTVDVSSKGERFTDETEIGIRPSGPLQKVTGAGSIAGGTSAPVNWSIGDYIPSSIDYHLVLSKSPAAELGPWLSRLVEYPYGCTEQTVSIAFPQLYFGDMADLVRTSMKASDKASANANVQEAIRKIKMRQLYNGAVTLWDGEGTEDWWATIYAAHFLIEAQKAGFDVEKGLLSTMLGYINNRLKNRETVVYWYNRTFNRRIAPEEVTYGLYVLALAGQPDVSVMNYYKANPSMLSLDCRYMLAAAYALAGDRRSFQQFLPASYSGEEPNTMSGGSFASDIRDESLALDVLVDADPNNAQIPVMARHVVDKLKSRYWFSTQELAFSVLGLGKVARQAAGSSITGDVLVDGKKVGTMDGNPLKLTTREIVGNAGSGAVPKVTISTQGTGKLYYFWETEGISSTGSFKEEDSYLKVRKRFFDRFGHPLYGTTFKQNDLIIVQITLERTFSTDVDNIVITDMLPAGFEIENPRTKNIPDLDWVKDDDSPTALDVRDDRINLFVNLHSGKQTYYYAVRAVSPGSYHMGPVSADAMYNGEYHSYNGAGIIHITQ